MSRPWIKVHTIMLHHPGIGRLSDGAYRAWITCLLMAAAGEELGRCGAFEDVAWQMHWSPEQLDAALAEIGDRIRREDGVLYVRDWDEWQERESAKERQRRHRGRLRDTSQPECDQEAVPVRDASGGARDCHVTVTSPSTKGHEEVTFPRARSRNPDPDPERDTEQPTPLTPLPAQPEGAGVAAVAIADAGASAGPVSGNGHKAQPQPRAAPADRKWAPFEEAVSKALGGIRVVQARNGRPLAWVGELCNVAGQNAGGDVRRAVALWDSFTKSEEWRYRPRDPAGLPAAFGAWVATNGVRRTQQPWTLTTTEDS